LPVKVSGISTSFVRPLSRLAPASHVGTEASGFVPASAPGGGVVGLRLDGGEREGPDCSVIFFSGVFSTFARDLCIICNLMGSCVKNYMSTAVF
jgi:hypothetical protein